MTPLVTLLVPTTGSQLSIFPNQLTEPAFWQQAVAADAEAIISLTAPPPAMRLAYRVQPFSALGRVLWPAGVTRLCLVGIGSGSTFALPLVWDLFHTAPVGSVLIFADYPTILTLTPLDRSYYANAVERADGTSHQAIKAFRKVAPTRSEADATLKGWSFCLPIEKPSRVRLEQIAARINELDLERPELLVCAPASEVKSLPPGWRLITIPKEQKGTLTAKKNALVEAASQPNICVFHDRLELPRNFKHAIERFGDHFGLLGFQNLFIDSGSGALSRYSDYHVELSDNPNVMQGHVVDADSTAPMFTDFISARQQWRAKFAEMSVEEFSEAAYLTGSLYMTKRSVWKWCGQAPSIDWNALEDVEFGSRAAACGIPSRVNAYGFVRTIRIRPLLAEAQNAQSVTAYWASERRPIMPPAMMPPPEATAATGMVEWVYRDKLLGFAKRWIPANFLPEGLRIVTQTRLEDAEALSACLIDLLYMSLVTRDTGTIRRFLSDFASSCMATSYDDGTLAAITGAVSDGKFIIDAIITNDYFIRHIYSASQRPFAIPSKRGFDERLERQILHAWRDRRLGISFAGDLAEFQSAILATL